MHTIRGRLALWYAIALGATMFVFALTIYLVQRSENVSELDARARLEADFVAGLLSVGVKEPGGVVAADPENGKLKLSARIEPLLEVIPDYLIVLGRNREALYLSSDARALPYGSLVRLLERARLGDSVEAGFNTVDLDSPAGIIRYYAR